MPKTDGRTLRIYHRFLPHWRLADATYFVTWRLARAQAPLVAGERDLVMATLRHFVGRRYDLLAYVVMDDHVHAIVRPFASFPLERVVQSWKTYSAHVLCERGRRGPVWQREYYDRIIRNAKDFAEKLAYVQTNPERRWPGVTHYRWAWYDSNVE